MTSDFITYAKYKVIRNKGRKIIDMQFEYANNNLIALLGFNPIGMLRSVVMPDNNKICAYTQNVIDLGVPKHFSHQDTNTKFDNIEAIIEPILNNNDSIYIYTIDVNKLKEDNIEQSLRNNVSTILSMFNISLLHWNAKEHYVYTDTILTTDFNHSNPDLYTGNNLRSSFELYKVLDNHQRHEIQDLITPLLNKQKSFLSFNIIVRNSIKENVLVKVNIIPEEIENMYLVGIQF